MKPKDILDFISSQKNLRSLEELSWYVCYKSYEGEHFLLYDRKAGKLTKAPLRPLFNPIPEIKKQVNGLINLITTPNLKAIVLPKLLFNAQISDFEASYYFENLLFDYLKKYKLQINQSLLDALIYPLSFLGVNVVEDINGEKDVEYYNLDVFDVLFDPRYPFEKQKMIVKVIRGQKDVFLERYKGKGVEEKDFDIGFTDYKSVMEQEKFSLRSNTAIYEAEIKEEDGLRIMTITPNGKVLRNEFFEGMNFFSIVPIHLSLDKYYYHPSFVEDLIPLQRSLDLMQLRIEDFLLKFTKGTWLAREGTEMEFSDESGVIVKWDGGEAPVFQGIPNLTSAPFNFLGNQLNFMERYGVSALALGKPPAKSNIRAGNLYAGILSQEIKNKQIEFSNYIEAIKKILEITSFYLASLWKIPTERITKGKEQEADKIYFVSEDTLEYFKGQNKTIIGIPKRLKNFDIGIDIDFGMSDEERRATIIQLAQFGVFKDPTIIVKYLAPNKAKELLLEMAKNQTLLQSPEIQKLISDANTPDEVKQALSIVFNYLAKQNAGAGVISSQQNQNATNQRGTQSP